MTSINTSLEQEATRSQGVWAVRFRVFTSDYAALAGTLVLLCAAVFCGAVEWFESLLEVSGVETDLLARFEPPSAQHWLGTDDAGRDELMRLLRGGGVSLSIAVIAGIGASLIGILIGVCSGYFRGKVDALLMRFADFIMSLPSLPLLIILAALDLTKLGFSAEFVRSGSAGYWRIIVIFILLGWTGVARLMRASTLALNDTEFVLAARAQGASHLRMMLVHIIPNAISPVIVATTLAMGRIILAESALSFLGVGIQPPSTSWGSMLNNAQELLVVSPPLALYPGLAILIAVVSINFMGDGFHKAFNPKSIEGR